MLQGRKNNMLAEKLSEVTSLLCGAQADAEKFDKGNSSAGTRVRKASQEAVNALKALRKLVSTTKAERNTTK